ncbi:MAG: enoyl-CoA hydratase/isomerase family protein, partial [Casimicrobiaceae bacterium]
MELPFEDLLIESAGSIATVTINRPALRNACRAQTIRELGRAIQHAQDLPGTRAIILTGSGDKAFSAGADLKELRDRRNPALTGKVLIEGWGETLRRIEMSPLPVIAAVRGYAVGGGTEIAMACHLRVAGESARFGQPEILRGHLPGAGGTVRLPRLIGIGRAMQYLLTGKDITAQEAERIGLANWIVPDADVLSFAHSVARHIASLPASAVRLTLQAVVSGRDMAAESALVFEQSLCASVRHA